MAEAIDPWSVARCWTGDLGRAQTGSPPPERLPEEAEAGITRAPLAAGAPRVGAIRRTTGSPRSTTLRAKAMCARISARGSRCWRGVDRAGTCAVDPASIAGGTKDCRRAAGGRNCLEPVAHDLKAHCMGSSWIEKGSPANPCIQAPPKTPVSRDTRLRAPPGLPSIGGAAAANCLPRQYRYGITNTCSAGPRIMRLQRCGSRFVRVSDQIGIITLAITLVVILAIWPFATVFVNQSAQRDIELRSQMLFITARDQVLSLQGPGRQRALARAARAPRRG